MDPNLSRSFVGEKQKKRKGKNSHDFASKESPRIQAWLSVGISVSLASVFCFSLRRMVDKSPGRLQM